MNEPIHRYPFTSVETMRDPFPLWRQMRADGPVVRSRIMLIRDCWFATTWESATRVLRDQDYFGRDPRRVGKKYVPGMQWWMPKRLRVLASNMLAYDREDHYRLRSLVDQAFLRSEVEVLRPRIQTMVDELLDALEISSQRHPLSQAEFVSGFCRQLPLNIICEVLGLPRNDRPKFKQWFRGFAEINSAWGLWKIIPGITKLLNYFERKFVELRRTPQPGLLSELVRIEQSGERLSTDELMSTVFILLIAGHETTVHLLSNGVYCLLRYPVQRDLLVNDWNRMPAAVEEILRYSSPIQFSKPRIVMQDTALEDKLLKKGDFILAALAAANTDPQKFDQPEEFRIERSPNPHMTFGSGVHTCLGLKLAKAETEVALKQLFQRFPGLSLESDTDNVVWGKRLGIRMLKRLWLRLPN